MHDGVGAASFLRHVQFVPHPMALDRHGVDPEGAVRRLGHMLMGQMKDLALLVLNLVQPQAGTSSHMTLQQSIHHASRLRRGGVPNHNFR